MSDRIDKNTELDKIIAEFQARGKTTGMRIEVLFDMLEDAYNIGWAAATEYYATGGSFK